MGKGKKGVEVPPFWESPIVDPHEVLTPAIINRGARWFKVNLWFGRLYGSVLGGEGFVAESGGECGGTF